MSRPDDQGARPYAHRFTEARCRCRRVHCDSWAEWRRKIARLAYTRGRPNFRRRLHHAKWQSARQNATSARHPHIGRLQWESPEDFDIAQKSLRKVGLDDLARRDVLTLSGGERRRLAVAQVLTQAPDVYLLDEPTNHLDPQHQRDVLKIFRQLADNDRIILASLHDVNLAAQFADRCLLLFGDGRWAIGDTSDVLECEQLSDLYHTPIETIPWRNRLVFVAGA